MSEHWSARQYLEEVWGYKYIEMVDDLTLENIQENADEGYPLDRVLVRAHRMAQGKTRLFDLGKIVMTTGVADKFGDELIRLHSLLKRHQSGDFGDLVKEDVEENWFGIKHGYRILSAYTLDDTKIWIITEADRSATTFLLPEEY